MSGGRRWSRKKLSEGSGRTRTGSFKGLDINDIPSATSGAEATPRVSVGHVANMKKPPFGFAVKQDEDECAVDDGEACVRRKATRVLKSSWFENCMMGVVLFDATVIAVEQSFRVAQKEIQFLNVCQNVILVIYIIEIILRLISGGQRTLMMLHIQFDMFLVGVAIISDWVLPVLSAETSTKLRIVVSVARLARPARCIRVVIKEPKLWMLVRGFVGSAINTIPYTMLLLTITIHISTSIALELITLRYKFDDDIPEDVDFIVNEFFGDRGKTMLTLLQFVCMDSVGSVYRPLISHDWILSFYFVGVIAVVAIVLMDVITAIIVHAALEQSNNDREAMRERQEEFKLRLTESVKAMFLRLDDNDDGKIDLQEILNVSGGDLALLNEYMAFADPIEVFDILDVDKSGTLDVTELCDGLFQSAASKSPVELKRIDKQVSAILRSLTRMQGSMEALRWSQREDVRDRPVPVRETALVEATGVYTGGPSAASSFLSDDVIPTTRPPRQRTSCTFDVDSNHSVSSIPSFDASARKRAADARSDKDKGQTNLSSDVPPSVTRKPASEPIAASQNLCPAHCSEASNEARPGVWRDAPCSEECVMSRMPPDTPAWALVLAHDIWQLRLESRTFQPSNASQQMPESAPLFLERNARREQMPTYDRTLVDAALCSGAGPSSWLCFPDATAAATAILGNHSSDPSGNAGHQPLGSLGDGDGAAGGGRTAKRANDAINGCAFACEPHGEGVTVASFKAGTSTTMERSGRESVAASSLMRQPPRMRYGEPPADGAEIALLDKALEGVVLDV